MILLSLLRTSFIVAGENKNLTAIKGIDCQPRKGEIN